MRPNISPKTKDEQEEEYEIEYEIGKNTRVKISIE